jgi:hypothetical protein
MSFAIRMRCEPLRSLAFGDVDVSYMGVGSSFDNPIRILHVTNLTDVVLLFSYDGIDDHFRLPRNGFIVLDVTSNKSIDAGCFFAMGDRIYVKQDGVPTEGTVNVTAYYALEG